MALVDYPPQLEVEAGVEMFNIVRNREIISKQDILAHRVWNLQGYLQGRVFGNPSRLSAETFGVSDHELNALYDNCTTAIDELKSMQYTGGSVDASVDPFTIILAIEFIVKLIQLLRK